MGKGCVYSSDACPVASLFSPFCQRLHSSLPRQLHPSLVSKFLYFTRSLVRYILSCISPSTCVLLLPSSCSLRLASWPHSRRHLVLQQPCRRPVQLLHRSEIALLSLLIFISIFCALFINGADKFSHEILPLCVDRSLTNGSIVNVCNAGFQTRIDACSQTDYICLCQEYKNKLTCYDNCPDSPDKAPVQNQVTAWCNAAAP